MKAGVVAQVAVGADRACRESSLACYVVPTHALSVQDTSVTAHCHAAPAQPTREYQGDHRRYSLTPATTCATTPLDIPFHISRLNM
jgi:hypothetical protein